MSSRGIVFGSVQGLTEAVGSQHLRSLNVVFSHRCTAANVSGDSDVFFFSVGNYFFVLRLNSSMLSH